MTHPDIDEWTTKKKWEVAGLTVASAGLIGALIYVLFKIAQTSPTPAPVQTPSPSPGPGVTAAAPKRSWFQRRAPKQYGFWQISVNNAQRVYLYVNEELSSIPVKVGDSLAIYGSGTIYDNLSGFKVISLVPSQKCILVQIPSAPNVVAIDGQVNAGAYFTIQSA